MTFTTPNGTRGGQQPTAAQMDAYNIPNIARIRSGADVGNLLVLVTIGRKSGDVRENPVAYVPLPDGSLAVVASAAGAAKHPAWYSNLAANPDKARVVVRGREVSVTAEELHGEAREKVWGQITASSPGFAQYETMTDRKIPVIRLTPNS